MPIISTLRFVERCLASSVAKAMEDKCEADRGRHPWNVALLAGQLQESYSLLFSSHRFSLLNIPETCSTIGDERLPAKAQS